MIFTSFYEQHFFAHCLFNDAVSLYSLVVICLLTAVLGGGFKENICDTVPSFT